jgi:hypothetical protein
MGRHLSEMTRILRWRHANLVFALLAILCAGSAMALPGPSGDITGFSSVLVVGAIALLAGHAWGILVIAAAELLIVGKAWPIVTDIITSGDLNSLAGGTKDSKAQRPAEVFSCVAATIWLVQPLLPML